MSQSDYIAFKRRAVQIKKMNETKTEYSSVLNSQDYTVFREFAAEKNISSRSPTYNQLIPSGSKRLFDIETSKCPNCPTFIINTGTQARNNRILNKGANSITNVPVISVLSTKKYVKTPSIVENYCDVYYNETGDKTNTHYDKKPTEIKKGSYVIPTGSHITNASGSLYRLNHLNKCNT
jgi:hypothetical protein